MARSRRRFSAEFKAKLAVEAIKGQRTVTELAGEHKVHPNQITMWKKQLLDVLPQVFGRRREEDTARQQEDRLLNLRLLEEINGDTFARKSTELRDRIADVILRIEAADRNRGEQAELAIKVFELSQALEEKWLAADFSAKRQILEMVFLNPKLDGATLCYETRKPFDVLVKGLSVPSNRGDRI